jgi:SPP1 gp7 family putative phage head morphogenesis protein
MVRHEIPQLNARLAALGHLRQVETVLRADRAADRAQAAALRVWRQALALLRRRPPWPQARREALRVFAGLLPTVAGGLAGELARLARRSYWDARQALLCTVPVRLLAAAGPWARGSLREDEGGPEPALGDLAGLLFPPPSEAQVAAVVFGSDWQDRLSAATRLASPEALADVLAAGLAAGKTQQEIARDLLPLVDGVRSAARRVARTEALRVAGDAQMRCHEQLGDLVVGYQVHATLDQHTRPWHAARSGQVYYLRPGPGQLGPDQMPHPPDEPRDPTQRPPGAPETAYNCRCYLTPVLRAGGPTRPWCGRDAPAAWQRPTRGRSANGRGYGGGHGRSVAPRAGPPPGRRSASAG